jgi:hypothetical protein
VERGGWESNFSSTWSRRQTVAPISIVDVFQRLIECDWKPHWNALKLVDLTNENQFRDIWMYYRFKWKIWSIFLRLLGFPRRWQVSSNFSLLIGNLGFSLFLPTESLSLASGSNLREFHNSRNFEMNWEKEVQQPGELLSVLTFCWATIKFVSISELSQFEMNALWIFQWFSVFSSVSIPVDFETRAECFCEHWLSYHVVYDGRHFPLTIPWTSTTLVPFRVRFPPPLTASLPSALFFAIWLSSSYPMSFLILHPLISLFRSHSSPESGPDCYFSAFFGHQIWTGILVGHAWESVIFVDCGGVMRLVGWGT